MSGKVSKHIGLVAVNRKKGQSAFLSQGRGRYTRQEPVELMQVEGAGIRQGVNRAPLQVIAARSPGGQVTAEDGYFDTERSGTNVPIVAASWTGTEMDPNTTAMQCLFAPVQGDDISNRRARKVFVKKIRISGQLSILPATGQASLPDATLVRIIVFMDKQTNGAQVSPATLMGSGNGTDPVHMFQSKDGFGRFKVFKDKTYSLVSQTGVGVVAGATIATAGVRREFSFTIKPNVWVNYNATNGGTVADIIDNSFHLACVQTNTAQAGISYKVRTVFTP